MAEINEAITSLANKLKWPIIWKMLPFKIDLPDVVGDIRSGTIGENNYQLNSINAAKCVRRRLWSREMKSPLSSQSHNHDIEYWFKWYRV